LTARFSPVAESIQDMPTLSGATQFAPVAPARKSNVLPFIGYGLALISLVVVFRDFHLRRTIREFSNVSWKWVFFDVLS
jgi:capsular polysaccharide biosynthesis protein